MYDINPFFPQKLDINRKSLYFQRLEKGDGTYTNVRDKFTYPSTNGLNYLRSLSNTYGINGKGRLAPDSKKQSSGQVQCVVNKLSKHSVLPLFDRSD